MKQQLIQTTKATILVVDLPEGACDLELISSDHTVALMWLEEENDHPYVYLPPGEWQLIGKTFELSEQEWDSIVDCQGATHFSKLYQNYNGHEGLFTTPKESGLSLLTANKVFKENPISSEKPIAIIGHKGSEKICEAILKRFQDQWQEAEQHVFRNAYTLIKK